MVQQEVDAPQQSDAGQLAAVEQLTDRMAAARALVHEPTSLVVNSSSVALTGAAETAPHSDARQLDAGEPEAAGAAPSEAVLPEPSSTAPTQAAETASYTEREKRHEIEQAGITKTAPAAATKVESIPETPLLAPTAVAETRRQLEQADRNPRGAASLGDAAGTKHPEVARATPPDPVVPPARATVAAAAIARANEIAPEERGLTIAEADVLLKRGDTFFASGDLASARTFYEYAATAGNGVAALRLGGTFDPAFLARARVYRVQGHLPSALYWYRRARDLGNGDAKILLKSMENTVQ